MGDARDATISRSRVPRCAWLALCAVVSHLGLVGGGDAATCDDHSSGAAPGDAFMRWAAEHGAEVDAVGVGPSVHGHGLVLRCRRDESDSGGGGGGVNAATRPCPDPLFSLPTSLLLSARGALGSQRFRDALGVTYGGSIDNLHVGCPPPTPPYGDANGGDEASEALKASCKIQIASSCDILAVHVAVERLVGDVSSWAPYLDSLPPPGTPAYVLAAAVLGADEDSEGDGEGVPAQLARVSAARTLRAAFAPSRYASAALEARRPAVVRSPVPSD